MILNTDVSRTWSQYLLRQLVCIAYHTTSMNKTCVNIIYNCHLHEDKLYKDEDDMKLDLVKLEMKLYDLHFAESQGQKAAPSYMCVFWRGPGTMAAPQP